MTHWHADNSQSLGKTPLIRLSSPLFEGLFDTQGVAA
jgi:hypothetical protein